MKLHTLSAVALLGLAVGLGGCNDDFLEVYPRTTLTEQNAFQTYDNFKAYAYQFYQEFHDNTISTNYTGTAWHAINMGASEFYSGFMQGRDNQLNPYAYQTFSSVTNGNGWDFSYIRDINILLSKLDGSSLTEAEKNHFRAVAYFFHSYWYMELVSRFGDIPYYDQVLTDESEEAYAPRNPRAEVVEKIIEKLEYAAANLGNFNDGDNTLTPDAVNALLSRFLLREGTWAKYHGLSEPWQEYLQKCVAVSEKLMAKYPNLYHGSGINKYPAAGYDELLNKEDLTGVPGVIMFIQYLPALKMNNMDYYAHVSDQIYEGSQQTADMFLMKNGKPITNPASGFKGGEGKDHFDYFADRDPRFLINFIPPFQVKKEKNPNPDNVNTFNSWRYYNAGEKLHNQAFTVTPEYAEKYKTYIKYFGEDKINKQGSGDESQGVKRLPSHNWGDNVHESQPNLAMFNQMETFQRARSGFYFWKFYTTWQNTSTWNPISTADKPIFTIEEVMLNHAEASFEIGSFSQAVADKTINKLRERAGVAPMIVSEIGADFDPERDKGNAPWIRGYDAKTTYEVPPVLWEIRRERNVELLGLGYSFYDIKRWHKAPYYVNRQPVGMWITATNVPYGKGVYTGQFINYNEVKQNGQAVPMTGATQGWIYTHESPLALGKGWIDTYYLMQVPTNQIGLNPNLTQNPGWDEIFPPAAEAE